MPTGVREWRLLYRKLTKDSPADYQPLHPGAAKFKAAVSDFEREIGYKLPRSYKTFAEVFGPGEIGGFFRIWIPGGEYNDLATEYRDVHGAFQQESASEHDKRNARFLLFGSTIGGDIVGWDPKDLTDAKEPEYRVYFIERHKEGVPVAASFPEFVQNICLANNLYKFCGWKKPSDEKHWPPYEFLPYPATK